MAVAFPYKKDAYERAGLLQLQDGPANLNEIEATVGMFDPLPADPADTGVLPDDTPADDQLPGVIEKKG